MSVSNDRGRILVCSLRWHFFPCFIRARDGCKLLATFINLSEIKRLLLKICLRTFMDVILFAEKQLILIKMFLCSIHAWKRYKLLGRVIRLL